MFDRLRLPTDVRKLHDALSRARRILVFTGAGLSVDSGIPDFRTPGGIWSQLNPYDLSTEALEGGPEGRRAFWRTMLALADSLGEPQPNANHRAVARLQALGKVCGVVTQNVDGLHQAGGSPPASVLELHGNLQQCHVPGTDVRLSLHTVIERVRAGELDPLHEGRPIRPDLVVFGDPLPEAALASAVQLTAECDLCLVLGSSLHVHPAAALPHEAQRHGAALIICTLSPTPLDRDADLKVARPLSESLVPAVNLLG